MRCGGTLRPSSSPLLFMQVAVGILCFRYIYFRLVSFSMVPQLKGGTLRPPAAQMQSRVLSLQFNQAAAFMNVEPHGYLDSFVARMISQGTCCLEGVSIV